MEKYLIHSNELHLIDAEKIHQAVEKMVESLDMAAGSTTNFDLYMVVENYFKDLEKRRQIRTGRRFRHKIKEIPFPITPDNFSSIKRESLTEVKLSRFCI